MASPPSATLGPVLEFMRSLWRLDHALSSRTREIGSRFGITPTQRVVLRIVGQSPRASAGAVARILHVHPSTLTPVLQQLVGRGVLRRGVDPLDRRKAVLWLTARGERVDEASIHTVDERIRSALAGIAPSELFHARRVIQSVTEALAEEHRPARKMRRKRKPASRRVPPVPRLERPRAGPESQAEPRTSQRSSAS